MQIVGDRLYDVLCTRHGKEVHAVKFKSYEEYCETYIQTLVNLPLPPDAVRMNHTWFQLTCFDTHSAQPSVVTLRGARINYKEYFTLRPEGNTPAAHFVCVLRFVHALVPLYVAMCAFAKQYREMIRFKVPLNLETLFQHPDSLTVHYQNSAHSRLIRKRVITVMRGEDLGKSVFFAERKYRAQTGFDFKGFTEAARKEYSHSQAVAHVIATFIVQRPEDFVNTSYQNFIQWLKNTLRVVNQWSEKQIADVLHHPGKIMYLQTRVGRAA